MSATYTCTSCGVLVVALDFKQATDLDEVTAALPDARVLCEDCDPNNLSEIQKRILRILADAGGSMTDDELAAAMVAEDVKAKVSEIEADWMMMANDLAKRPGADPLGVFVTWTFTYLAKLEVMIDHMRRRENETGRPAGD